MRALLPRLRGFAGRKTLILGQPLPPALVFSEEYEGQRHPGFDIIGKMALSKITQHVIGQRMNFRMQLRRDRGTQTPYCGCADVLQRRFQLITIKAPQYLAQPLIAARQHVGQQGLGARHIVIEMRQHVFHICRCGTVAVHQRNGRPRRFLMQAGCVFHRFRLRAKLRQHRHLPRQAGAQGIDGLDTQLRGIVGEVPAGRMVSA